jgi:hypothetical protein
VYFVLLGLVFEATSQLRIKSSTDKCHPEGD